MEVEAKQDWICMRTIGPFDFQTTGVVQSLYLYTFESYHWF
jgi:hypothetical protein